MVRPIRIDRVGAPINHINSEGYSSRYLSSTRGPAYAAIMTRAKARLETGEAPCLPERRARSGHDAVLRGLGPALVSGQLAVGAMLPSKDELSRRFGVSRTSLREALQTLAAKGLIAAKTKVGTWVLDEGRWNMFDSDILP